MSDGFEKVRLTPDAGAAITAMFNPKELSLSKSVPWEPQASTGADTPEQQFNVGQGRTLTFELFFDRFETVGSVVGDVAGVEAYTKIQSSKHRPPIVTFSWGSFSFKGVFKQIQVRYTMFLPNGDPCRATVNCTMQEYESLESQGRSRGGNQSPDHAKLRRVKRGETLQSIAYQEYDDPAEWRRIADANGIDDPLDLDPGAELLVPPILN